jgi:hypothetical protein
MKSIEDKIIRNQFRAGVLILGIWIVGAFINIKWITMLTNEERLLYDMLSAKIGYVPIISIENKRETKRTWSQNYSKLLNTRLYEQLKKICKNSIKKSCNKLYSSKIVVYLNIQNNH